jgi:hypothetical protein
MPSRSRNVLPGICDVNVESGNKAAVEMLSISVRLVEQLIRRRNKKGGRVLPI